MRLNEIKSTKLSYWELLSQLGIDASVASKFHDAQLPWVNYNDAAAIDKLIKVKKYRTISHVRLYYELILKVQNFGHKVATVEEYEKALDSEITVWRGGGGTFDPDLPKSAEWVAGTTSRQRVHTFSDYMGTRASRSPFLNARTGAKWIVEIKLPIREVLLSVYASMDSEVIIPKKYQKSATVITQT